MKQRSVMLMGAGALLLSLGLAFTPQAVYSAGKDASVSLILKNESSGEVQVEMIDRYGGNVTVTIESGTSQNHTVKLNSALKVDGNTVHKATTKDEGTEVVVGR